MSKSKKMKKFSKKFSKKSKKNSDYKFSKKYKKKNKRKKNKSYKKHKRKLYNQRAGGDSPKSPPLNLKLNATEIAEINNAAEILRNAEMYKAAVILGDLIKERNRMVAFVRTNEDEQRKLIRDVADTLAAAAPSRDAAATMDMTMSSLMADAERASATAARAMQTTNSGSAIKKGRKITPRRRM
tara:strand:+ start:1255 stop:1806 length:552 start_codon:yes stop_codon:yes gene_type:complete